MIIQHPGFSKLRFQHILYEYTSILIVVLESFLAPLNPPNSVLKILCLALLIGTGGSFIVISFLKNYEKDAKVFRLRIQGIALLISSLFIALSDYSSGFIELMLVCAFLNLPIYFILTPVGFYFLVKSFVISNAEQHIVLDARTKGIAILLASVIYHTCLILIGVKGIVRDTAITFLSLGLPAIIILVIILRLFVSKHYLDLFLKVLSWSMISFLLSFNVFGGTVINGLPAYLESECGDKLREIAKYQEIFHVDNVNYASWDELIEKGFIDSGQTLDNYIDEYTIKIFDVKPISIDNAGLETPSSFTIVAVPREGNELHLKIRAICDDQKPRSFLGSIKNFDSNHIDLNDESLWEYY